MLRPKKNILRKEIKRDPFLESVDQAQAHMEQNKSMYFNVGLVILVFIVGFTFISNKKNEQKLKASAFLAEAFTSKDKDDIASAQFQIQTILNDFQGTPSAINAAYFIGKMKYESGNFIEAEAHLNSYLDDNPKGFLSASASIIIADINIKSNNHEKALNLINERISTAQTKNDTRTLKLHKAKIELAMGNEEAAKLIVDEILNEDNLTTWHKKVAQEIMGNLTS